MKREVFRRTFGFSTKANSIDPAARSVRVIASTDAIDSYDEIVEQSWDLSRYEKNPVVLYNHVSGRWWGSDETLPIGYASDVKVVDGHLEATLHFVNEEATELAERVWQGILQGSLRAVSVGFYPRTVVSERIDEVDRYVLKDNELFEISVVPLPANPEAVALSVDERNERLRQLAATATTATSYEDEEQTMNDKEAQALRDELAAAKSAAQKAQDEREAAQKAAAEALAEREAIAAEKEAAIKARAEAERKLSDDVVEKLRGVKLYPAEIESMQELRALNAELYERIVAARPDIKLAADITGEDTPDNSTSPGAAADDALAAAVREA